MCVTANPATIVGTRTFVHATTLGSDGGPVHISGYQNEADTFGTPNCMFLNFAGSDLALVRGPERTTRFMADMTRELPELVYVPRYRSSGASRGMMGVTVEEYGDYTVVLAQGPADILSALDQVPFQRRPRRTPQLQMMVDFYMSYYPQDTFVLGCFDGKAKPKHPITVSYRPRNPNVLTIPGLDGHDGRVPVIGQPVYRDFRLAFGVAGVELPYGVDYRDRVEDWWAPSSVTGFVDNRFDGSNGDYVLPIDAVTAGLRGRELAAHLVA